MNNHKHHRQENFSKSAYAYRSNAEYGMDARLGATQNDGKRAFLLDNLYRDKTRAVDAVETFPGYRRLQKSFGMNYSSIHGLYRHRFAVGDYLIVHRGDKLYLLDHDMRDEEETPVAIATVADAPSKAYLLDGFFHLFDGQAITKLLSPTETVTVGDGIYGDEEEDLRELPDTNVYIPHVYENGIKKEERNLFTRYYDLTDQTTKERRIYDQFGLKLRSVVYESQVALEVYGFDQSRKTVFVPNEAVFNGTVLPIVSIAPNAFARTAIESVILSENVKQILGNSSDPGAFCYCMNLKRVVMYGIKSIGMDAFYYCLNLREVVLPNSVEEIHGTAFSETPNLSRVYYEGNSFPTSIFTFTGGVEIYGNTFLGMFSVGDEIKVPLDPDIYTKVFLLNDDMKASISGFGRYSGWEVLPDSEDSGYSTVTKAPTALCAAAFDAPLDSTKDRYAFFTVLGDGPLFSEKEEPIADYRIPLPDDCHALAEVTLNEKSCSYTAEFTKTDGVSRLSSILLTLPKSEIKRVRIRIFSSTEGRDIPLKQTKAVLEHDGTLYFTASADEPKLVFCGESKDGLWYFPENSHYTVKETVKDLSISGGRPCALTETGVFSLHNIPLSDCLIYDSVSQGGKRYLLLSDGIYEGSDRCDLTVSSLTRLSDPIAPLIERFADGSLLIWNGYLVVLFGNYAFLADLDRSYRENGRTMHPWYRLSSLGDAVFPQPVYRHLSIKPYDMPDRVNNQELLILGREDRVTGTIYSFMQNQTIWYYTKENGKCYAVTSDGEIVSNALFRFHRMVSLDGVLYFASENGSLFAVNTDKRENGNIPADCYHYARRAIPTTLITESADMDCAYRPKETLPKSLTVSFLALPYTAFEVSVASEEKHFSKIATVGSASLLDGVDFSAFSFFENRQAVAVLPDRSRFTQKTIRIASQKYCTPMAICQIAYRYLVRKGHVSDR